MTATPVHEYGCNGPAHNRAATPGNDAAAGTPVPGARHNSPPP
jgi:hypothetical protein